MLLSVREYQPESIWILYIQCLADNKIIGNRSRLINNPHFEAVETYLKITMHMSKKIDENIKLNKNIRSKIIKI